jgi:molybdate transport system regulatory protein
MRRRGIIMKIGARNQIVGKVTGIKKGAVMCQVKVDVPACELASVMTVDSLDDMGIKVGSKVRVVAKAVTVLLIKE